MNTENEFKPEDENVPADENAAEAQYEAEDVYEEEEENTFGERYGGSSIVREIEYYLTNKPEEARGEQNFYEDLYKKDEEIYAWGMIRWEDVQIPGIYHIDVQGEYVVVSFAYKDMMVNDKVMEEYLVSKWSKIRLHLLDMMDTPCMHLLAEKGLGIKIFAFAAIGGYGYKGRSAIVYTPDYLKENLKPLAECYH